MNRTGCLKRGLAVGIGLFITVNLGMLWVLSTMDQPRAWTQANAVSLAGVTGEHDEYSIVAAGGEIFAIGGNFTEHKTGLGSLPAKQSQTAMVRAYDPATGVWRDCAPLPEPREGGAAVATDDAIYLFGGTDATSQLTASVMRYEIAANSWQVLPDAMPQRMHDHTAGVTDGVFYIMGLVQDSFVVYCWPGGQGWHELKLADLDLFMAGSCRATVHGNKLWLTGVMDATRDSTWVVAYTLPDSRAVAAVSAPLPVGPTRSLTQGRERYGVAWCADQLYLMGGHEPSLPGSHSSRSLVSVDVVDPDTPGWHGARDLAQHKCWSEAANLPAAVNNRIYFLEQANATEYLP